MAEDLSRRALDLADGLEGRYDKGLPVPYSKIPDLVELLRVLAMPSAPDRDRFVREAAWWMHREFHDGALSYYEMVAERFADYMAGRGLVGGTPTVQQAQIDKET